MKQFKQYLTNINACSPALEWVGDRDLSTAWAQCQRGDWMLWIASRAGVDLRTMTRAKVECAKLVEHLLTDPRSIEALHVAERFADGDATKDDLRAVAAYAYAYAADADAVRTATLAMCADICREYIPLSAINLGVSTMNANLKQLTSAGNTALYTDPATGVISVLLHSNEIATIDGRKLSINLDTWRAWPSPVTRRRISELLSIYAPRLQAVQDKRKQYIWDTDTQESFLCVSASDQRYARIPTGLNKELTS
jgi:hypothetical protein